MSIRLSVIIPTYNKFDFLQKTLLSFNYVEFNRDEFEVIVCINGYEKSMQYFLRNLNLNYKLVICETSIKGRAHARNFAINKSEGDILVFNDDDTLPSKEYLNIHYSLHKENCNNIIIGKRKQVYISDLSKLKYNNIDKISYTNIYYGTVVNRIFENKKESKHWITCLSGNFSARKVLIDKVGMFDKRFVGWGLEDFELGYRLSKAGCNFVYSNLAVNYHIEHKRSKGNMIEEMYKNMECFYKKYNCPDELYYFWKFYCGLISLEEYDGKSYKELDNSKETYFKLFCRNDIAMLK